MKRRLKKIWGILKQTGSDFIDKRIMKLSAALAYYTIFSLPPVLIIVIWISNFFYGRDAVEGRIYGQVKDFVGSSAAQQIQETIRNASFSPEGSIAYIIGIITLIIGATTVFSEMQDSINFIWNLRSKPKEGKGWLRLLVNRLLSFSVVVSLGFILLVSLVINAIIELFGDHLRALFPQIAVVVVYIINFGLTFLIIACLFGIIFKVLPDACIEWKQVKVGAITTTILFMIGKSLIGLYLGQSSISGSYGAAGSVIVILVWVYYSSVILYFGAAFTRVYAQQTGQEIYPNEYAVWIKQVEIEKGNRPQEKDKIEDEDDDPTVN